MEREYVGIDLHRRRSVIVRKNAAGEVLSKVRIENSPMALAEAVAAAGPEPEVVLEATFGWYWAADVLEEMGARGMLGRPVKISHLPIIRLRLLAAGLAVLGAAAGGGGCWEGGEDTTLTALRVTEGRCSLQWAKAELVGSLPGERKEVSGFVASAGRKNVAWMVRDSGNPAALYSFEVDRDGRVMSRSFPVEGATNGDWEDLTYTRDGDGQGHLWILDIINRHTSPKTMWEVAEPASDEDSTARLLARYRWRYPDGNHDTETLLMIGGHFVVVSKTTPSRAYVFDEPLDANRLNTPRLVGAVPGPRLVLGSTTADERLLLTSSTKTDTVYVAELAKGWTGTAPVFEQRMPAAQREAGDFFPYDSCDIVLLDEQEHIWQLRNKS